MEKKSGKVGSPLTKNWGLLYSPILFNNYIDDIIRMWKQITDIGVLPNTEIYLHSILCADNMMIMVIVQNMEDNCCSENHIPFEQHAKGISFVYLQPNNILLVKTERFAEASIKS